MYPITDPQFHLDLHRQRAAELYDAAAARRLYREAARGRHRRAGRWPRASARPRPDRLAAGAL